MAPHYTAQNLASLGRRGDSVLVHMQPQEVAGLQALAQSRGTSLTINPATGMPEAFNLGGFFSSLLPMFAGMALGPVGGIAPLLAGAVTGAGLAAAKGDNVLMGGLMGGLGGYGGGGLSTSLGAAAGVPGAAAGAAGAAGAVPTAGVVGSTGQMGSNLLTASKGIAPGALTATANAAAPAYNFADTAVNTGLLQAGNVNPALTNAQNIVNASGAGAGSSFSGASAFNPMDTMSKSFTGLKNISGFGDANANAAWEAFKGAGGSPMQLAMPAGGALLSGIEPSDLGYGGPSIDEIRKKTKYRGPSGQLNLDANYNQDTGEYEGLPSLQLATGGTVNTNQGTVSGGGIQDLYGANDNTGTAPLSQDGYGIGRLDKLAQQGSLSKAGDMFYAQGGPVSFADGGDSNKEDEMGLPSLSPDMPMYTNAGADTSAIVQGAMQAMQGMQGNAPMTQGQMPEQSNDSLIAKVTANLMADPNYQPENPIEEAIIKQLKGADPMQQGQPSQQGLRSLAPSQPMAPSYNPSQAMAPSYNPSVAMGPTYYAGMNAPRGYAHGGYLDGPGDGLSDSIPATIEGKQPARLADGEFVISADVVSALGNGSSKAGAKHLYSMMDRVRQNAHGTKKQIRKVNTKRVMPA